MPLDTTLFHQINGAWTSPVLDWWGAIVRATELWILPSLVAVALAFWKGSPRLRRAAVLVVLIFPLGDALIVRTGKALFARPRPDTVMTVRSVRLAQVQPRILAFGQPLVVRPAGPRTLDRSYRSFPSGHAWNAFAVATVFAVLWRRWGWTAWLVAAAIAYARVYAGLHWPSDVVISALVSVPVTYGLILLLDRLWRRAHPRLLARFRWAADIPSLLPEPAP